ncbi:MAG: LPS assembly lipoprotein LptE [bacterium]
MKNFSRHMQVEGVEGLPLFTFSRATAGMKVVINTVTLLLVLFSLASCGYTVRNSAQLPFQKIEIVSITNRTTQPNLEDIFHKKLAQEFIREGIQVVNSSTYALTADITEFTLQIVAEKNEFSTEYEVVIRADVRIAGPDGFSRQYLSKRSPFIESFVAEKDINSIMTLKEVAVEKALVSLARTIVIEVVYR